VDAGIGGQTADVVGQKLKRLSQRTGDLCHSSSQIASYADRHYFISVKRQNLTRIALLQHEDRVQEIAEMRRPRPTVC
jgi:DNA repair protein RecN (Recombination protein N)